MVIALQDPSGISFCGMYRFAKSLLIILLFLSINTAFAQDVIYTLKGAEIKCKVQEVGEDSVSYNDVGAVASAKSKAMVKTEINKIKYANGFTDVINAPLPVAKTVVKNATTPAATTNKAAEDIIFTTDGKQLIGKVTAIDDGVINYVLKGSTVPQQINSKNIIVIKYSNGTEEAYNKPTNDPFAIVLQNWKRKYIAPPLEIF